MCKTFLTTQRCDQEDNRTTPGPRRIRNKNIYCRWFQTFFIFTPTWGNDPIWRAYFSHGLVQPPTRNGSVFYVFVGVNFDTELRFEQIRTAISWLLSLEVSVICTCKMNAANTLPETNKSTLKMDGPLEDYFPFGPRPIFSFRETTYIPCIYGQLGDYMLPTTYYWNQETPFIWWFKKTKCALAFDNIRR